MPYIEHHAREDAARYPSTAGELNYAITSLLIAYLKRNYGKVRYDAINEIMGAMTCAGNEFYRRVAVPYENAKIVGNGDVFPEHIAPFDTSSNLYTINTD